MKNRILIVDDAILIRLMLKDILETNGYAIVGEADEADQAFEIYQETQPDLVTMDITLTSSSGIDAIRNILKYDNNARIVVISALEQKKVIMEALKYGAKDFIIKPFEEDRVINSVKNLLSYA